MEEKQQLMWESEPVESMVTVTLGRAMSNILSARPRKLHEATSHFSPNFIQTPSSLGSLEDSLSFLREYIKEEAEKEENLDSILIPIIEHSLKHKDLKHGGQAMILINWFFKDDILFRPISNELANIITRKEDHYIALGWCTLVRSVLEYESATTYQYPLEGIMEKYNSLLKTLRPCISHLLALVSKGSAFVDGFELPSRLSASAADCLLALTEALANNAENSCKKEKSLTSYASTRPTTSVSVALGNQKAKPTIREMDFLNMETECMLCYHLEDLINLVQRLVAWSRKSQPLHAKGLESVLKWLKEIKEEYRCFQNESGSEILKTGALLLASCWKHYSKLLRLQDPKFHQRCRELLEQYLSGMKHYTKNLAEEHSGNKDANVETRKFFLNCLCLLLGRFESKKFESIMAEYGMQISDVLLSQLHCADEDVVTGTVSIFKAAIFDPNRSVGSSLTDSVQMDSVLTSLLQLLDERDVTASAAVKLIAECCCMSSGNYCVQQVLIRLASGNDEQRRNAIDVIAELIQISSFAVNSSSHVAWNDIANHLLDLLGDEVIVIREQASNLLSLIEPSLVLPALVHLVYSSDEKVHSAACAALIALLKHHNQNPEVICMLLDCLSNASQGLDPPQETENTKEGSNFDSEKVLRLIPEWSKSVQVWDSLIGPLVHKMFADPANATMVRFLSYISEHLADSAEEVLHYVQLQMQQQKEIDDCFLSGWESRSNISNDSMQKALYGHLCPLLVIRLLPLRVFNDLGSPAMYGNLAKQRIFHEYRDLKSIDSECVAALILNRALAISEFEDVRKLAAELCGRIHPKVLFPIIAFQLRHAAALHDTWKIKSCLFSLCTSLVVRGRESVVHLDALEVRKTMEMILLWPSVDDDEVSKAQHGCIDCLALMICAELQALRSSHIPNSEKKDSSGKTGNNESSASKNSILAHVIHRLMDDKNEILMDSATGAEDLTASVLSFRLCMANVLISACQKINDSGRKRIARTTIPRLINSVEGITNSDIRAACGHVLFSAVYHLKSAVVPYSMNLLKLSLNFLKKESDKERMAGAKLIAALMASEEVILLNISGGLLEAKSVLSSLCCSDPSLELRQICMKLLTCISPSYA